MKVSVPVETCERVVDYIETADQLLHKAAEDQARWAKDVPLVVDTLIKRGFVEETMRQTATANLIADPVKALTTLRKTAEAAYVPPPMMGKVELPVKEAAGQPKEKASDVAWKRALGF